MQTQKGFTLIELLIVIGIIGVLLAAGATSYTGTQAKARDTRRRTDIKEIQHALEQYYALCPTPYTYPTPNAGKLDSSITCGTITPLNPVPKDPKSGADYTYAGGGTSYSITATLDDGTTAVTLNNKQ